MLAPGISIRFVTPREKKRIDCECADFERDNKALVDKGATIA